MWHAVCRNGNFHPGAAWASVLECMPQAQVIKCVGIMDVSKTLWAEAYCSLSTEQHAKAVHGVEAHPPPLQGAVKEWG